jgi:hypothetical protein
MIRIACLPLRRIRALTLPFILTMALGAIASTAQAGNIMRKISELEPITPAMTRLKPDFETGGVRVDMPASEIMERLRTSGFTMTLRFLSRHGAGIDNKYFETEDFDARISVVKMSDDKSRREVLDLNFLPGQGGLSSLSRHVEFFNQPGRTPLKRRDLEADLQAKYGLPTVFHEKFANKARKSPNAHVMGLYCFEAEGTEMIAAADCDLEKAHKDGYFYDMEVDERGDVVSLDVNYDASSYAKSYDEALYDKMKSLIENDEIWEFRVPRQQP